MKTQIKKQKNHAFGKDIYLLGQDEHGTNYWLEAPSWDCAWYWGFGYVETYTNNRNPQYSKDIDSHSHVSGLMGPQEYYDTEKQCFRKGEYIHNIYDSPTLNKTTFTKSEGWQLSELFKQFYLLKDMADFTHKKLPSCNLTTPHVNHGDLKDWNKKINTEMIPLITAKIIEILTPA